VQPGPLGGERKDAPRSSRATGVSDLERLQPRGGNRASERRSALDTIDIIHARFPCRSPDLHFFGYRFRISIKGEFSEGEICWNFSTGEWSWRILPGQPLSRLNPRD
jgi:hypothetical protein